MEDFELSESLLIPEPPLIILPSLAVMIGLNEAIVVQQLHYLLRGKHSGVEIEGRKWIWNTYEEWCLEVFPFWSVDTIKRTFSRLEEMFIIESCQPDGYASRRKYYRLNEGMMKKLIFDNLPLLGQNAPMGLPLWQNATMEEGKMHRSCAGASIHAETSTENTPLPPKGGEVGEGDEPSIKSKVRDRIPTIPEALRVSALFGRKKTTEWMPKEIKAFKRVQPMSIDDLALLETYYAFERQKNGNGMHRRDLQTFLNNYYSELDRARAWRANPKANEKSQKTNGSGYSGSRNAGTFHEPGPKKPHFQKLST